MKLTDLLLPRPPKMYPIQQFIKKVTEDPFSARENPELINAYNDYVHTKNWCLLPKHERVLKSLIVSRSFSDTVNEFPHIVFNSLKYAKKLYSIPSYDFLHSPELKSGDFVSEDNQMFEFKTRFEVKNTTYAQITKTYCHNTNNNDIFMTIVFKEFHWSFNYMTFMKNLTQIGFLEKNIQFVSLGDLMSLCTTDSALLRFGALYDIPLVNYLGTQYSLIEQKCNNVLTSSTRKDFLVLTRQHLSRLQNEKKKNPYSLRVLYNTPPSKFFTKELQKQSKVVSGDCNEDDFVGFKVLEAEDYVEGFFNLAETDVTNNPSNNGGLNSDDK